MRVTSILRGLLTFGGLLWAAYLLIPGAAHCQGSCPTLPCLTNDGCGPICQCDGARIERDPREIDPNTVSQAAPPTIIFGECMPRFPDETTPPGPRKAPNPAFPENPGPFNPAAPEPGPGDV